MNASEINTDRLVSDLKSVTRDAEELLKTVSGEKGNGSREMRIDLVTLERRDGSWVLDHHEGIDEW